MSPTVTGELILNTAQPMTALRELETQAGRTDAAFMALGTKMDAQMTVGSRAVTASGAAATRAAGVHESSAKRVAKAWYDSGSAMVRMGQATTLALAGGAAASVDLAMKFQKATLQFQTQAGVSADAAAKLKRGILDMAASVGQTPDELAGGMYHIVSSMNAVLPPVHRARVELGILREAAKGAAIGGANLTDTAYVLSSAMNALGEKGIRGASHDMAVLNAIVGTGDMHMQDLMGAMRTGFVSAARTFGLSLQSAGAALAYMTDRGVPAEQAATRLRMTFSLMGAPTMQSAKLLTSLGMSSADTKARTEAMTMALEKAGLRTTTLARDMRKPDGIFVALRDLKDHLTASGLDPEGQTALISRAFGGGRSGATIMAMYNNIDVVRTKYAQQTKAINAYDSDWAKTQRTLAFQLNQAKAGAETLGTELGTKLIPYIEKAITGAEKLYHWFTMHHQAAQALAGVIGGVLVASVVAFGFNVARRIGGAARDFYNLGKSIASLPFQLASKIEALGQRGSPGASTGVGGMPSMGLKSVTGPGSEFNPLVVTMMGAGGALGAAGAAESVAARDATVLQDATAPTGFMARARSAGSTVLGAGTKVLGGALRFAGAAAIGYAATQILGSIVPGEVGRDIKSSGIGAAAGAGLGALAGGVPGAIVGAVAGVLLQTVGKVVANKGEVDRIVAASTTPGLPSIGFKLPGVLGAASPLQENPVNGLIALVNSITSKGSKTAEAGILMPEWQQARRALQSGNWRAAEASARQISRFYGAPQSQAQVNAQAREAMGDPHASQAEINQYVGGSQQVVMKLWRDAGRIESAAIKEQALKAAHDWTQSFVQGLAGTDPTSAQGKQKVTEKTAALTSGVKDALAKLLPSGRLQLAQALDAWAQQMEQKNPALKKPMEDFKSSVTSDMHALGQNIQDVNGQVLTDSTQQWQKIATSLTDPTDKALEHLAGTWSTIKQEAVGALEAMGWSAGQAAQIVSAMVSGTGFSAAAAAANRSVEPSHVFHRAATGARVPGPVSGDSWTLLDPGGRPAGFVGGGELLIANRHTEARASRATMAAYGKTLGQMVAGETTPHTAGFATGGVIGEIGRGSGIAGALWNSPLMQAVAKMLGQVPGMLGGMGGLGGGPAGPTATGSPQQARVTALVRQLASRFGWGSPAEINAWLGIISRESGFNPTIQNPTTTAAYGLGQFFNPAPGNPVLPRAEQLARNYQKYRDYGGDPNTIMGQLIGMANYIKQNWGDPINAGIHEQTSTYARGGRVRWGGWHAAGGDFIASRPTLIGVGDRPGGERVTIGAPSSGGGGGINIQVTVHRIDNYQQGDIRKIIEAELEQFAREVEAEHRYVAHENELSLLR